jgi:hypothetical protein
MLELSLYPVESDPSPHWEKKAGWTSEPVWTLSEKEKSFAYVGNLMR